jgi:hypothetical protein
MPARSAEMEQWLVKINPQMAKQFREADEWWDAEVKKDPTNQRLKAQAAKNHAANLVMAKETAKIEANEKAKAAHVKPIDPDKKIMYQNMVIQAATNAANGARANAATFGGQVVSACMAFQVYSKSKLDELEDEISAGDFLGPLVAIVTGGIGGALEELVVDELGKKVVKQLADIAKDKMAEGAKEIGKDSKDLEKAVGALILGANDTATAMTTMVNKMIVPLCDAVIKGVNSNTTLSPELTEFIEPFIMQEMGKMDSLFESRFGLPTPARAKRTQVHIYEGMVKVFEEKLIISKIPSEEKFSWIISGIPMQVHYQAEKRARNAAGQREKEINQKQQEMGI